MMRMHAGRRVKLSGHGFSHRCSVLAVRDTAAGQDHAIDTCFSGTLNHRLAIIGETVVRQVGADVDQVNRHWHLN